MNANEVDMNHPFMGCREPTDDPSNIQFQPLIMQYGNPALDCLQSYILVDLGRMDDKRLGLNFFLEWKANVQGTNPPSDSSAIPNNGNHKPVKVVLSKKRRRSGGDALTDAKPVAVPLGSLSLHNCTIADETFSCMVKSGMCMHLAVLDLTGLRGLTDKLATMIFEVSPNIERLSLKNCRKITGNTTRQLILLKKLKCLDVGGCFNVTTQDVLDVIPSLPELKELHGSGLPWNDESLQALVSLRDNWHGLSLGFSTNITQPVLRECLMQLGDSLRSLALPFCENIVDNALLGVLGRNMPVLQFLDLRGNGSLTTITGFYDGRTSADLPALALTVVGRYSGLSEASVEETRRVHLLHTAGNLLTVYLDEKGMGAAVTHAR
jgi:solute carrier family 6 GABA transporter-like protein 1